MSKLIYEPIQEVEKTEIINAEVRSLIENIAPLYDDKREVEKVIQLKEEKDA